MIKNDCNSKILDNQNIYNQLRYNPANKNSNH